MISSTMCCMDKYFDKLNNGVSRRLCIGVHPTLCCAMRLWDMHLNKGDSRRILFGMLWVSRLFRQLDSIQFLLGAPCFPRWGESVGGFCR